MLETLLETDESNIIALLVEDNERVLESRTRLLENEGFITCPVKSYDEAVREFRSVPRVDLVVTDINLAPERYQDHSGAELAQMLRAISSDLPIYGYSALFAEGQLPSNLSKPFTSYYPKGKLGPDDQLKYAAEWKQAAIKHRDQRLIRAKQELERLRTAYSMDNRDYLTLRELTPGSGSADEINSIEEILAQAGYRIKLIEPGQQRPSITEDNARTRGPIVFWLRETGETTIAEVYAYPALYGQGNTEEDAIRDVLLLMDGYAKDLKDDTADSLSPELLRLRDYLNAVLEA